MKKHVLRFKSTFKLFLFILIIFSQNIFSQNVITIGTGTITNTTTTYPAPYGNYFYGARHQILIPASEIIAAGGSYGSISALAFDVVSLAGTPLQAFEIKMGTTSLSAITSWQSGLTSVYSQTSYTETNGWNTHNFVTNFQWNGTDNLVVEVCFNNTNWTDNAIVNQSATTYASCFEFWADTSGVCINNQFGSSENQRPNIRFTFLPDFALDAGITAITNPSDTVGTGTHNITATLTNFGINTITSATIRWSLDGISQTPIIWTGSLAAATTTNPILIDTFNFSTGSHTLKVWSSLPNSITDSNAVNDTTTKTILVQNIVTIGTGTITNDSTTYPAPYGNFYEGARHQILIPASEIIAAGGSSGNISALAFDVVTSIGTPLLGFEIKMGTTSLSAITSWQSGLTSVYSVSSYTETSGWNIHNFGISFPWNGTDNLVVEVCFNNNYYTSNAIVNQSTTTYTSCIEYHDDAAGVCLTNTVDSSYYQRPNLRFTFLPNVALDAGISVITNPTNSVASGVQNIITTLTNFGNDTLISATIGWSVDGITQLPFNWTGSLAFAATTSPITIDSFNFSPGTHFIKIWSFLPNSSADLNLLNDTLRKTILAQNLMNTVTIGTGTFTNTAYTYPAPYGNYFYGARHQILILASEIINTGGSSGNISALAFDVVTSIGTPLQGFEIKMGTTSLSAITSWHSGLTSVYSQNYYADTIGWNTHNFGTNFYWNGTDNLVVEVCFNNTSFINNSTVNQSATTYSSCILYYDDTSGVCINNTVNWTYNQRPNIRLSFGNTCPSAATISPSGQAIICPNDSIKLSATSNPNATYAWIHNGIIIQGATDSILYANQSGLYQAMLSDSICGILFSPNFYLIQHPSVTPLISSNGSIQSCTNDSMELYVPAFYNSYLWSNGATTQNTFVKNSGNYTVTVTNANSCKHYSNIFKVNATLLQIPDICIVGIDSATNNNRIIYERQTNALIDSFNIYKESSVVNVYQKIGSLPYNAPGIFIDPNSNPAQQDYKYKISAIDTCGTETSLSDYHKTIHLTINKGMGSTWNLIWLDGYIGFPFGSYYIYRGIDSLNLILIDSIQSTAQSYTDLNPPNDTVYYQLEVVKQIGCYPDSIFTKANTNYNSSRSNVADNIVFVGFNNIYIDNINLNIYPNPNKGNFVIDIRNIQNDIANIKVTNILGLTIYQENNIILNEQYKTSVNLKSVNNGVYFVIVQSKFGRIVKKLIVN